NGQLRARRVSKLVTHSPQRLFSIETSDPQLSLVTTSNHTLFTNRGWIQADRICRGDELFTCWSDVRPRVSRIGTTDLMKPVYNLVTGWEHNYIAEGFVAHNFTVFRRTRTFFYKISFDLLGCTGQ